MSTSPPKAPRIDAPPPPSSDGVPPRTLLSIVGPEAAARVYGLAFAAAVTAGNSWPDMVAKTALTEFISLATETYRG